MTAGETVYKVFELSYRLKHINRSSKDDRICRANFIFKHLEIVFDDTVVVFSFFQSCRTCSASDTASDIQSLCVDNLISASGYASRAPYSASFVRMSQFAFFFPNDKPKIFIVLSLSLFILTLASMITDPDIVYVFKYKSASLRRLPFFCRLSSLKNDLSFHFSFYHKNMRSKLHL